MNPGTVTKPKPRCPECGSGQTYIRVILKTHLCRQCGNEWPYESKPEAKP